jgi:hypothetical protein
MADYDSNARNIPPQLDASQIAHEAREIARESLASLFLIWLDVPEDSTEAIR